MIHSAEHIAEYLISKSNPVEGGELLSNMKLQKLLYYCQGFYYAKHKEKLFDDKIYAWQYGPVVPNVYHNYKHYYSDGIPSVILPENFILLGKQKEMIDDVFNYFNQFSAIKLMNMTHAESPWCNTRISDEITLESLAKHFEKYLKF
ncbi:MAG: type II toxin-antitoxin system antitoxin SocA domain-containing protein [Lutibacter sp.]